MTEIKEVERPWADAPDASWRERAVERSLRTARAKALSRSDRFIQTAIELLSETGRTDFTVQELVERSKTSLRSFYQHFAGKDELLLALFEEVIAASTSEWRAEVAQYSEPLDGLRALVLRVHAQSIEQTMGGMTRALALYHLHLAETRPGDYAQVLGPLRDLVLELVEAGLREGQVRHDLEPLSLTNLLVQALVGATHMHALDADIGGESLTGESLWAFCAGGIMAPTTPVEGKR